MLEAFTLEDVCKARSTPGFAPPEVASGGQMARVLWTYKVYVRPIWHKVGGGALGWPVM